MSDTVRISLRVQPEATIDEKYFAALCIRKIVMGIPEKADMKVCVKISELPATLKRLGLSDEQVSSVQASFGRENAITVTSDVTEQVLQDLGFAAANVKCDPKRAAPIRYDKTHGY